jgi:hypothetical protein
MTEVATDNEGMEDPQANADEQAVAHRWILELQAARKGPYVRWLKRAKQAIRRYRDEDMDSDEAGITRRNAQFNVLWSNVQTVAPSVYSRAPKPVAQRRYLDRDVLARAASTILQRSLGYTIEDSGLHDAMLQCRTDYFLVGMGSAWVRYQAEYAPVEPQHQNDFDQLEGEGAAASELADEQAEQQDVGGQAYAGAATERVSGQRVVIDYCHWSDELVSPARFWSEVTWRAKRAYYTRRQLRDRFSKEIADKIPLVVVRGKKEASVTDQVREAVGKAEVWQIWDMEAREVIWICEAYNLAPLKHQKEDKLNLSCFVPAARPVRGTTTNDSFWPIPDYSIWRDQAAELDNLTARIAALTRAIKAVGVFDNSFPELERILQEGMENKLIGVKNWAKLAQRGGLDGSVGLLPIKEMADTLTALYMARAQVKQDLYEISGVADIQRGSTDPNETAAAQKMKGAFSSQRGSDRRNEFNRFVRDTLIIMAEVMLEHFTSDQLYLMSDFEQWFRDQDPRSYAHDEKAETDHAPPMMGHNGGPPLDAPASPMPGMPGAGAGAGLGPYQAPAAPQPDQGPLAAMGGGPAGVAPQPGGPSAAALAPQPGMPPAGAGAPPPTNGQPIVLPHGMTPPGAGMAGPPAPPPVTARDLFEDALDLLRKDKLCSFRIQVETNSTIEPDATEEKQARIEFLGAVTQFLAQAQEMAGAYPQLMPVLGKMLLFGARGFQVGSELESALEGLVSDLEGAARNPAPKPPSPEELKGKLIEQQGQLAMQKAQIDMQGRQQELQMEMQRMTAELQAKQQEMQMQLQALQQKLAAEQQIQAMKLQGARETAAIKQQEGQQKLALSAQAGQIEAEGMQRQDAHEARSLDRKEAHDQTTLQLAEEAARAKAANAAHDG